MSRALLSKLAVLVGVALCGLALLPGLAPGAAAAPLAALTPSPEPTVVTATPEPTLTPTASATPLPTATATQAPTATPEEPRYADPKVSKSASPSEAAVGDTITFTIRVTNDGNEAARDVVVTDSMPRFLEVLSADASRGDVTVAGGAVTVRIGTVNMGDEVMIEVRARVLSAPAGGEGANSVELTTSSGSDRIVNNVAVAGVRIVAGATQTPLAEPASPVPAASPVAAPAAPAPAPQPAALPRTAGASGWPVGALLVVGLAAIGAGLCLRRPGRPE